MSYEAVLIFVAQIGKLLRLPVEVDGALVDDFRGDVAKVVFDVSYDHDEVTGVLYYLLRKQVLLVLAHRFENVLCQDSHQDVRYAGVIEVGVLPYLIWLFDVWRVTSVLKRKAFVQT